MTNEAKPQCNTLRAEIYAGNRYLATWTKNATHFNHSDWLGTERGRTRATDGSPCETITSLPFGGYKQSGFGREMGPHALESYTQVKSVWVSLD